MSMNLFRTSAGVSAFTCLLVAAGPAGAVAPVTGPSTSVSPYVLPASDAVALTSLLTVDDQDRPDPGVDMVGIPDGLGAYRQGRNLVLLMNHEFVATAGEVHDHGETGAFVSRNVIDPVTGRVKNTGDLIQDVAYYDYASGAYVPAPTSGTPQFNRFCSGSLSDPGVLYDKRSKSGYRGQFYFGNEENHPEGRTFAVTKDGLATQLPRLGLAAWENTLVADTRDDETVVIGTDDNASGQLRIYVGEKQRKGSRVARAGLTNGELHVLDVKDQAITTDAGYRTAYGAGQQVPVRANQIDWDATGAAQETESVARGMTLNRIEDGEFDPKHPNDFYFLTTEGGDKTSVENDPVTGAPITRDGGGLWRLRFADVSRPSAGMTLELLLDGTEAPYLNKPDNMDIDSRGHVLIQEDPGSNAHLARVLAYEIASGDIAVLAQFDPARFASGATGDPATIDEESSGIIDVANLMGRGTFLLDAQAHTSAGLSDPGRQVEHGQLLRMKVNWDAVF
jgi:hypothetical protein